MAQIKAFAPLAERIVVPVVPGNHDEATRDFLTLGSDSWAVDAIAAVREGVLENPELRDRVEFLFPERDGLTITLDTDDGMRVAMAHGHQFPNRADYWRSWWSDQASSRTVVGEADLLLAAHRHHLRVADFAGGRTFIQIPALDGGSGWFDERKAGRSRSRLVSFTIEGGEIRNLDPIS